MKLEAGLRHNKATGAWDLRQADDGSIWREATLQGGVYLRVASSYEEYLSGEEDSHE